MNLEKSIKKVAYTSLVTSALLAVLGIIIFLYSEVTMKIIGYLIGAILLITGISKIYNYLKEKGSYDIFNYDLVYGIITIVFGIVIISKPSILEGILGIAVGIWMIYNSLIKLTWSLKMKSFEIGAWLPLLLIAIAMMIVGIYIIFSPDVIIATLGAIIFGYSIVDIIEEIIFINKSNKIIE